MPDAACPVGEAEENVGIAIVVLTHNRVHLLRQCVERALMRTSPFAREIVLWNNGSTDGTRDYLDKLDDPRIRVIHHETNIGQNGYALAFALTSAPYMVEVDDDIIDAPPNWDAALLDAFRRLPQIGFLAANLVDNPHDMTAQYMYHRFAHQYRIVEENGVRLKVGPTGGGCTMTSRELHDRVGGFRQSKNHVWWLEDAAYIIDIEKLGFRAAYLNDLQVLHAGGPYYSEINPEKQRYFEHYRRRVRWRRRVKRALLWIPLIPQLNSRFGWFHPPRPQTATHTCPAPGCTVDAPSPQFACQAHWYSIPKPLRDELWRAYHEDGPLSEPHRAAMEACSKALNAE